MVEVMIHFVLREYWFLLDGTSYVGYEKKKVGGASAVDFTIQQVGWLGCAVGLHGDTEFWSLLEITMKEML